MALIKASVGLNGINKHNDIKRVQLLLNQNRHLSASPEITVDSIIGPKTIKAIKVFQSNVLGMLNPDGLVDPDGKTLRNLIRHSISGQKPAMLPQKPEVECKVGKMPKIVMRFPFNKRPRWSYTSGGRYFGAKRKGGRLHAGCDLLAPEGTAVYAVEEGKITAHYPFYSGTDALEVKHKGGFIVRYGEISKLASGLKVGSTVKRGQHIAYVGKLNSGSSMLHFELYTGSQSGKLTNRSNKPYQRRSDLIDPTPFLDKADIK